MSNLSSVDIEVGCEGISVNPWCQTGIEVTLESADLLSIVEDNERDILMYLRESGKLEHYLEEDGYIIQDKYEFQAMLEKLSEN